jgi:hypothetical protein
MVIPRQVVSYDLTYRLKDVDGPTSPLKHHCGEQTTYRAADDGRPTLFHLILYLAR